MGDPLDPPASARRVVKASPTARSQTNSSSSSPSSAPAVRDAQVEVAAVRDRAADEVDEPRGAGPAAHRAVHPVDGDQGPELADAGRGVAPGEHVEDEVELAVASSAW